MCCSRFGFWQLKLTGRFSAEQQCARASGGTSRQRAPSRTRCRPMQAPRTQRVSSLCGCAQHYTHHPHVQGKEGDQGNTLSVPDSGQGDSIGEVCHDDVHWCQRLHRVGNSGRLSDGGGQRGRVGQLCSERESVSVLPWLPGLALSTPRTTRSAKATRRRRGHTMRLMKSWLQK